MDGELIFETFQGNVVRKGSKCFVFTGLVPLSGAPEPDRPSGDIFTSCLECELQTGFEGNTDVLSFSGNMKHVYQMDDVSGKIVDTVSGFNSLNDISGVMTSGPGLHQYAITNGTAATSGMPFPSSGWVDPTSGFAVSFWFNHDGAESFGNALMQGQTASTRYVWRAGIDPTNGDVSFIMQNTVGTTYQSVGSAVAATSGVWHHAVCTKQGNTIQLWVNGSSQGTDTVAGTLAAREHARMFARNFGGSDSELLKEVALDEVYIWEGLTFGSGNPSEADFVAALYNSGSGRFYKSL